MLFYQLWGRLLYDPQTPDAVFRAGFVRRYGKGADALRDAYALAGTTPLRLASSFDFSWDFTLHTYRLQGGEENRQNAVKHLENALRHWDEVIRITRPLYNDMPLVHYSEQNDQLRFHWEKLRPEVARDVEIAKGAWVNPPE